MSDLAVDHSALMDKVYRQQRHIYDLTRAWYLLGRDRMIAGLDARPGLHVLEVGCGTGRNLTAAARCFPLARLFGMDISSEMLISARNAARRADLVNEIRLAQGDATNFDPGKAFALPGFDRVFMSYTLSMIPDWQGAVAQAMKNLAPHGELHIVDFGQQERLPRWFRSLLFKWLGLFHVSPRADLKSVLEQFAARHNASLEFTPLYRGYAWSAVLRLL
ncbi:MAG: class I SAM-dependent methyltransferase [Parvibaculum sp.]